MTKDRARIVAAKRLQWAEIAEKKAQELQAVLSADSRYNDFAFWSEPIKIGHHSEGRHRRIRERYNTQMRRIIDLEAKAKMHRSKAENLLEFANRNKGDAEARREEKRRAILQKISLGSKVTCPLYSYTFEVIKINTKTVGVKALESVDGWQTTLPIEFLNV